MTTYSVSIFNARPEEIKKALPEDANILIRRPMFIVFESKAEWDVLRECFDGISVVSLYEGEVFDGIRTQCASAGELVTH